jgi:hypothetical protein
MSIGARPVQGCMAPCIGIERRLLVASAASGEDRDDNQSDHDSDNIFVHHKHLVSIHF